MGVHGLWKLLDSVGEPIPVETLENQILAVDVSIWLHQLMKGFQDSAGSTVPNAHLVGLFHRICKLLFFRIRPVFVFDGGVPVLKKKTIANRNQLKDRAAIASEKARQQLLKNLLKQRAVGQVLEDLKATPGVSSQRQPDLYELPPIAQQIDNSEDSDDIKECSSSSEDDYKKKKKYKDLHTIDVKSAEFKALPADIRHDILTDLKETRKQNSWGRIHELPEDMGGFSSYQMSRLLKRRSVQVSLEEAEKEMGGHTLSLADIETLLAEQGVDTTATATAGRRIASDNVTRYVYANELLKEGKQSKSLSQSTVSSDGVKKDEDIKWEDEDEIMIIDDEIICTGAIKVKTEKDDDDDVETTECSQNTKVKVEEEEDSSESAIFEDIVKEEMELRKQFATDDMGISQEQILLLIKEQKNASEAKESAEYSVPSTSKDLGESRFVDQDVAQVDKITKDRQREKTDHQIVESDEINEICEKSLRNKRSDVNSVQSVDKVDDVNIYNEDVLLRKDKSLPKTSNKDLSSRANKDVSNKALLVDSAKDNEKVQNLSYSVTRGSSNKSNSNDDVQIVVSESSDNKSEKINVLSKLRQKKYEKSKIDDDDLLVVSFEKEVSGSKAVVDNDSHKIHGESEKKSNLTRIDQVEVENDSLEITVSTQKKEGGDEEEEDIFADIFSNDNGSENIVNLLEKEGKQEAAKDIELMSSATSSSDDVINDIISEDDSSAVDDPEEVEKNERENVMEECGHVEDEVRNDDGGSEPHSSQYFKSPDSDLVKSNAKSPDTAATKSSENVPVTNDGAEDAQTERKKRILSTKELKGLQSILEKQEVELIQVQGREERLASTVTEQMRLEAEELLQLFGVPWVKAPMEAEAQCAFLDLVGLTQGTITDDSDIWLFGANRVYKNFFNQNKYVLQFRADDIKSFFKLSRGDLIELALLVGSDYTVGINGIGPVTALEIISTFRPASSSPESILSTLRAFKQWLQHPSNSKTSQLARKLKDVELDEGFPSADVVDAYLKPCVDESEEAFSWGSPDIDGLKVYAQRKFGWSPSKVDQLLLPVIKSLTQKTSQTRIETFFNMKPAIPQHNDRVSRRVQRAVERMGGGVGEGVAEEEGGQRRRARDLLAEGEEDEGGGGRGRGRRVRGGKRGRGGIRDEIRIATERDRFRSRQPRSRPRPTPPHPVPGPSSTETRHPVATPRQELIPQRERDRLEGLKRKIQAINVLKTKKKVKKVNRPPRAPIRREADLSESSGSD
ncbi:DNA repair protein complementing XP-G cells [Nilaparvata lugens]|uniref:DNA repair protein complementing XP-G cells n=1 Tax=Nilaparvata lugens TaxID=108931 RepID=UPI00193E7939|nr:DNA repair protein complementing XP-G cells [Nilaparvata lugens]